MERNGRSFVYHLGHLSGDSVTRMAEYICVKGYERMFARKKVTAPTREVCVVLDLNDEYDINLRKNGAVYICLYILRAFEVGVIAKARAFLLHRSLVS